MLNPKEKHLLFLLFALALISGIGWVWADYLEKTNLIPDYGGEYSEALVGAPQFINPILTSVNDVDRDIATLVYSGLTKYDKDGNVAPDLAEDYQVSQDGRIYTFKLRQNIKWHDGKPFTADDVVFTISAITDPEYDSPLRFSWQGVVAEKQDDFTVRLKLANPYAQFLEKTTLGIIPKHIWSETPPRNIILAEANLKPVGTGPYGFIKLNKDKSGKILSMLFAANKEYYGGAPYIGSISLNFFASEKEAINAYKSGDTMGVAKIPSKERKSAEGYGLTVHNLKIPKYFAVFLNPSQSKLLADKDVRQALALATNKTEIIEKVFSGNALPADSPIAPWSFAYNQEVKKYEFDLEKAKEMLEKSGWQDKNGDGAREKILSGDKEPTNLEILLATSNEDLPDLMQMGELIKEQWGKIGVKVTLQQYEVEELKQKVIKSRKYDALIFGEVLSQSPDPYVFWHSSQKKDPGLNLATYENKEADKLLEDIRTTSDLEKQKQYLYKFQELISEDAPAVFISFPYYLYGTSKKVRNIETSVISMPAKRFTGIEKWYIESKRVEKTNQ